jgi:PAS domain S-box-containing protein
MKNTENHRNLPLLTNQLLLIVILTIISVSIFIVTSQNHINRFFEDLEKQYRQGLINIISVAKNLIEPVLQKVRSGEISKEEAIKQIRPMLRSMTYEDRDGKNYIFMTSYDGTSLVQPYDPGTEMKNRIDLRDFRGIYILRELLNAAKTNPSGSFVRYHYPNFSAGGEVQEKLTYVVGLPDIECYIATGMYMKNILEKQRKILSTMKYTTLLLLSVIFIPVIASVLAISKKNRQLLEEISIRNKAEEDLKKSEEKYRSIFENSIEGLYQTTTDGHFININPSFAKIFGYSSPDELTGRNIDITVHYIDPEDRRKILNILYEKGYVENFIVKMKRTDGTFIWASINSRLVKDESGNIIHLEGRLEDITARKQAEDELIEKEKRLSSIAANMPGVIYQFYAKDNGEMGLDYASWRITEIFDLPCEMNGLFEAFYSNIHEDDRDRFMLSIKKAVTECRSWDFQGRYVKPSGEVIWFHGLSIPARYDDRVVFDGMLLDITERKHAEALSRMSEEKFCKVFMTSPDGIIITRMDDGLLIDANDGAANITGWDRSEVIGTTLAQTSFWINQSDRKFMVRELNAGRDVINYEFMFRRKDGSERHGVFSARPINIAGESCLIFILRDITDSRRLEEEHRKLEQQLAQSQKMDAIGQLAGGVAHDFNNILMILQGNISLIMMKYSPGDPLYDRLRIVEENIQRGVNLTRQLLGFAREGKYEVRPISVNDLIRKTAGFFLETKKEIEADLKLDKEISSIEADPGQLEQVFLNIFINASHAMPDGGRLIIVTSSVILSEPEAKSFDAKAGVFVKISITDTGAGMDQQTLERIFEPFFTTRAERGGSGLGLASAYGIIRNHGGTINAYSEPGKGTTFNIYLPSSENKTDIKGSVLHVREQKPLTGSGTILLIDDEPTVIKIVSEMLKTLGYTVYNAAAEQDAVSIYTEKKDVIDLVILDMILRGTSGAHVLKKLKGINPSVKVILSSGYSLQGEVQKVMEMGCLGFIQKPYNFAEMSSLIHKVLMPDK